MKANYIKYLFILNCCFVFSQSYNWDSEPDYNLGDYKNKNIVSVKETIISEFSFDENEEFVEYFTLHKAIYLNSDDAIESYNKIYMPFDSEGKLTISKARVITPGKEILELDKSKFLTATDEETKRSYKYFAFEGIEKGSVIEYFYTLSKNPGYRGKRISFDDEFVKLNSEFQLIAPNNFHFKHKSFNGLGELTKDESQTKKNIWKLEIDKLDPITEEEQALFSAERKYLVFALDYNSSSNTRDITSYSKTAQNIYNYYKPEISKKSSKQLKKIVDGFKLEKENSENSIRSIDNFIKTDIYLANYNNEKLSNLESILDEKVASEVGVLKLYRAFFDTLGIKYEIVITCSRETMAFDKTFEALNFLQDFLFYFPNHNTYLAPNEKDSRYGFPPGYLTDNYGLFIKEVKLQDFVSATSEIKYIDAVDAEKSKDNMDIFVSFDEDDFTETKIQFNRAMTGYYGSYIHPFMDLVKGEDREELIKSFAQRIDESIELDDYTIENGESRFFGVEPLVFKMNFTTDAFVEKAGNKYLIKVGQLIGPQTELYQEKKREFAVQNEFERFYDRQIHITIPEGYEIANLEDIDLTNVFDKNDETVLLFKSHYKVNGNVLTIFADEYYKTNIVDVEDYEDYRRVINSAADFNKLTLVLIKK